MSYLLNPFVFGSSIVTSGLLLKLDAADPTSYSGSGNTWYDVSGNSNNATLVGPTYNSSNGGSIVFDGVDDYAYTATSGAYVDMTIALYINAPGTVLSGIIATGVSGDKSLRFEDANLQFRNPGDGNDWANPSATTFYVNGAASTQLSLGWNIISGYRTNQSGFPLTFTPHFGSSGYPGRYLNGRLGCICLYNRQLTATEVTQNFNALRTRYGL